MVDGVDQPGADGKPVWQPRSAEDLERLTGLVKSAIGFDEKRGDQVQVVSMRFVADDVGSAPIPAASWECTWRSPTSCIWRKPLCSA